MNNHLAAQAVTEAERLLGLDYTPNNIRVRSLQALTEAQHQAECDCYGAECDARSEMAREALKVYGTVGAALSLAEKELDQVLRIQAAALVPCSSGGRILTEDANDHARIAAIHLAGARAMYDIHAYRPTPVRDTTPATVSVKRQPLWKAIGLFAVAVLCGRTATRW